MLPPWPPSPQENAQPAPLPPLPPVLPVLPALPLPPPPKAMLPLLPATLSLPLPLMASAIPELPALRPAEFGLPPDSAEPVPNILGSALPQPAVPSRSQAIPVASAQARLGIRRAGGWGNDFTKVGNPVDLELVPDLLSLD